MGFDLGETIDENGNKDYKGFFIYADRESLQCIEDVAAFIADLLDEQKKGNLPYDLLFLWDSIGSIPCRMSIEKNSNSPMWNAGAMSQQFANFINQRLIMSRKESQSYTNTMLCVNKVWVEPAAPTKSLLRQRVLMVTFEVNLAIIRLSVDWPFGSSTGGSSSSTPRGGGDAGAPVARENGPTRRKAPSKTKKPAQKSGRIRRIRLRRPK
jgi:hypothetical protein